MKIVTGSRACMILYNFLKSNALNGSVLMPSNICESVPATYMKCGFKVVFCDINKSDWQIDRDSVREVLKQNDISVLHYNHTYGLICDEDIFFLREIKNNYPSIVIVDDRCLCFPEDEDKCNPSDLILYSTGRLKCVDIGGGGYSFFREGFNYDCFDIIYSESDDLLFNYHVKDCHKNRLRVNKSIMMSDWLDGTNRFENLEEYFDLVAKEKNKALEHKKRINQIYKSIPGSMDMGYCSWRYQILLENSQECINALFDKGLFCSFHYKSLGNGYFSNVFTPNNNWLENHVINLFNDFRYTEKQAKQTAEIIQKIGRPIEVK